MITVKYRITGCEGDCDRSVGCPVAESARNYIGEITRRENYLDDREANSSTHMLLPGIAIVTIEKGEDGCMLEFQGERNTEELESDFFKDVMSVARWTPAKHAGKRGNIEPYEESGAA